MFMLVFLATAQGKGGHINILNYKKIKNIIKGCNLTQLFNLITPRD